MKFSEVRSKGYNAITSGSPTHQEKLIAAQRYIDQLASITGVDITDWDLSVFKNERSDKDYIHTDKGKINLAFFKEFDRLKAPPPEPKPFPEEIRHRINSDMKNVAHRISKKIIDRLGENNADMILARDSMKKAIADRREIVATQGTLKDSSYYVEQIRQILEDPFWTISPDCGSAYYAFLTPPITLFYKHAPAAIDLVVPMGRLKVNLRLADDNILVESFRENVFYCGYFHPHVSTEGAVCFGNMSTDVAVAIAQRDYVTLMSLTKTVLINYSNGNPFVYLHCFQEAHMKKVGGIVEDSGEIADEVEEEDLGEEPYLSPRARQLQPISRRSGSSYGAALGAMSETTANYTLSWSDVTPEPVPPPPARGGSDVIA